MCVAQLKVFFGPAHRRQPQRGFVLELAVLLELGLLLLLLQLYLLTAR